MTTAPAKRFPLRIGRKTRPFLFLWGVFGGNAYVDINGELEARFGFFRFRTQLSNVKRWRLEGPWHWITAIGVRRGIHGDITFAGTSEGGIRLDFKERVRWSLLRVPVLYLTVDDLEGFSQALSDRGIPGEDARRRTG